MHTPNVEVYVSQIKMSWLASSDSCVRHVLKEAASEGSDEPAHWHSLARAYTIHIVYMKVNAG